ncbi:MAG: hypothetical protein EZS28_033706 [Streblomastix strix]|uniref:Uncharacterized protein n=1 Tax=Streblomastix strix TaxID=222440 RepID=A0A5J4UK32_9EUKA|nr:MAG: hypothetical protein EZS28_033706 [Streblomastix strix]
MPFDLLGFNKSSSSTSFIIPISNYITTGDPLVVVTTAVNPNGGIESALGNGNINALSNEFWIMIPFEHATIQGINELRIEEEEEEEEEDNEGGVQLSLIQ